MLAAVLAVGLSVEIDLIGLFRHYQKRPGPVPVCGIKVVGYHITGRPGQQFGYARETFTIPVEGYVEVIALPTVKHYQFDGRRLPLDEDTGPLDPFSFRWITLPASPAKGGTSHESSDRPHAPGSAHGTH